MLYKFLIFAHTFLRFIILSIYKYFGWGFIYIHIIQYSQNGLLVIIYSRKTAYEEKY